MGGYTDIQYRVSEMPTCNPYIRVRLIHYFHSVLWRIVLASLPPPHRALPGWISPKKSLHNLIVQDIGVGPIQGDWQGSSALMKRV